MDPKLFDKMLGIKPHGDALSPLLPDRSSYTDFYAQTLHLTLLNPFPDDKCKTLPNWKSLQTTVLNLMKMVESSPEG